VRSRGWPRRGGGRPPTRSGSAGCSPAPPAWTSSCARTLRGRRGLWARLLEAALVGLRHYAADRPWRAPAAARLPFRELGLAIGLRTLGLLDAVEPELADFAPLADEIGAIWSDPDRTRAPTWTGHRDINTKAP